ncbi:MAG TPA: glycosyltransferase family 4 protein [Acidobacteriota bacterium]|nr:glycosyltransferase family 4 protein [Acidobacteriota bacterium]
MKILYWTPLFWPDLGGIEVLAIKTLPAFRKRGHEILVITSHGELSVPDKTEYSGIPVYRFPFWKVLAKRDLKEIRRVQKEVAQLKQTFNPDIVHLHYPGHIAYFHLHTLDAQISPTLLTVHTDFSGLRADENTLFGKTIRSADWVTAVSKATLSDTLQLVPEIANRSSVIYNGLEFPDLPHNPISFHKSQILYIGRLAHEKGVDIAITAFASVQKYFPDARMVIAGDGPARIELEQQAASVNLNDSIKFTGWISPEKVPELLNQSAIVVMPSRYREPLGLVAIEAAQMCRPVVATRVGGLPEVVKHEETGLLCEKENAHALTEAILFLLKHPDEAIKMGQLGNRRAAEVFGLEKFIENYEKLYSTLIGN